MKYPTTRFVFDRKNTATKSKEALVQVEVLHERKKKYITTGVYVYKDQWQERRHVFGCDDCLQLNERIEAVKSAIDGFINSLIKDGIPFTWERLDSFLTQEEGKKQTFIEYVAERIRERNDIKESTRKSHGKILASLEEYGRIETFEQLTKANIAGYYEFLLGREITKIGRDGKEYKTRMAQQTVWGYMKILRTYIHDAMLHEKIASDPSFGIKVKRGDYEQTRWLTEEEVKRIEDAELSSGSLVRVRDLFIFSCYSGLAFSDLMDFRPEKIEADSEGNKYLYGKRIKTGQEYIVLILPKAKEILEKYDYRLPKYTNQQYNHRLKDLAEEAGIDKNLSSHWSRISFGYIALNKGVRIEVVSKALGHATISETQRTYSRILKKTVVSEMSMLIKKGED